MTKRQSGDLIFNLTVFCVCETYYRITHDICFNLLNSFFPSYVSLLPGTVLLHGCYEQAFCLQIYEGFLFGPVL
jgi:hypothetical protein